MTILQFTRHGSVRIQQRAFRGSDIEVIYDSLGTEISGNEMIVLSKVAEYEIRLRQKRINKIRQQSVAGNYSLGHTEILILKREIHQIERIRNRKIVVDGTTFITGYPTTHGEQRRCLRKLRRKSGDRTFFSRLPRLAPSQDWRSPLW